MLIFALDDEPLLLSTLERAIREAAPDAQVRPFTRSGAALAAIEQEGLRPDAAFLDIEMPGMNGLELAKRLKDLSPRTNIIFVTGFSQYAVSAAQLHASGYVLKPLETARVRMELEDLRQPVRAASGKRIRVQCFGEFEVFADGKPVSFYRRKSKELLAYLIDRRGASQTMAELAAVLWEDGRYNASRNSQLHSYLSDLVKSLDAVEARQMILRGHNSVAVDRSTFDCDYYQCVGGNPAAINSYFGEYMSQYAWAEFTTGELTSRFGQSL